ncbi:hypothetical protein BH09SUM1_BH09SUM1_12250 [soil metagenome]
MSILDNLTRRPPAWTSPWIAAGVVTLIATIVHWIWIFNFGRMTFFIPDWEREWFYAQHWIVAMRQWSLPWDLASPIHDSARMFAVPETMLSPQVVLLRWMPVGWWTTLNVTLFAVIGWAGCLRIATQLRLSILSFAALWLIICFNGYSVAHLLIGHFTWTSVFVLPWLLSVFIGWRVEDPPARRAVAFAVVLFLMLLQGSQHIVAWCLILTLCFGLCRWRLAPALVGALALWCLLSSVRLLPTALTYMGTKTQFLTGYPSPMTLVRAIFLVRPLTATECGTAGQCLDWWEYDAFLGFAGAAFCAIFSGSILFRRNRPDWALPLAIGAVCLTILSIGAMYRPFMGLNIPLLSAQRVSTRFVLIPITIFAITGAAGLQRWLEAGTATGWKVGIVMLGLIAMAGELLRHSITWQMTNLEATGKVWPRQAMVEMPPAVTDPAYHTAFWVGLVLTLIGVALAAGWLLWTMRREKAALSH